MDFQKQKDENEKLILKMKNDRKEMKDYIKKNNIKGKKKKTIERIIGDKELLIILLETTNNLFA